MRSGSEVDKPTRLIDKPPAQPPVNQIRIDHFVDVVNQSAYLCVVRQTHIKDFSIHSERAFPRLRSHRENHVKMLQDLVEANVYVRVTPRTPMVPSMLGIKPGTAIVNCHGSLWVMLGGAVSFGCRSNVPAAKEPMVAEAAP